MIMLKCYKIVKCIMNSVKQYQCALHEAELVPHDIPVIFYSIPDVKRFTFIIKTDSRTSLYLNIIRSDGREGRDRIILICN